MAGTTELERFLTWAEGDISAIPRAAQLAAIGITLLIWLLIVLQLTGAVDRAWWLIPMVLGIVLSFACARRTYAVFDRVGMGQRALVRYSVMLGLAFKQTWSSAELILRQNELRAGGDAPGLVRQLSRLTEWSELRTAAALLHFPIQSLTLWDFHVLYAMERWRIDHGREVRRWLDALARFDALSVLAGIRHDCPEWTYPRVATSFPAFAATDLGHPLIPDDRRIVNDVEVGPPGAVLLVTGSNMSGKSTLLRAIGLNAVLAQAGAPVCATDASDAAGDLHSEHPHPGFARARTVVLHGGARAARRPIVDAAERHAGRRRVCSICSTRCCRVPTAPSARIAVRAIGRHLLARRRHRRDDDSRSGPRRRRAACVAPRGSTTSPSRCTATADDLRLPAATRPGDVEQRAASDAADRNSAPVNVASHLRSANRSPRCSSCS